MLRFPVNPKMVPEAKVARLLGVSTEKLAECRAALEKRGFPAADPDLGTTCLQAVDNWIAQSAGLNINTPSSSAEAEMKSALENQRWQQ